MNKANITIQVTTSNLNDELDVARALQDLANNITPANLKILAKKSKAPNINAKIQKYKMFL